MRDIVALAALWLGLALAANGSAIVATLIANAFFLPHCLLPQAVEHAQSVATVPLAYDAGAKNASQTASIDLK